MKQKKYNKELNEIDIIEHAISTPIPDINYEGRHNYGECRMMLLSYINKISERSRRRIRDRWHKQFNTQGIVTVYSTVREAQKRVQFKVELTAPGAKSQKSWLVKEVNEIIPDSYDFVTSSISDD